MKNNYVRNIVTSGARIEGLNHYITPVIKKQLDYLILFVRTEVPQPTHLEIL